jgi:ESF2/ABP1 family protein
MMDEEAEQKPREEEEEEEDDEDEEEEEKARRIKEKRRKKLQEENAKLKKRGVCYLSRVPPHLKPLKLRQILSQHGEILRIYLAPEDPAIRMRRKRAGGNRGKEFTEGWVEFAKKSVAKRVASMLNGEHMGGKKRSAHYYDLWNIKYLRKFKWDNLIEEIAYKNAVREQKLAMEISVAKKERDFYLAKVDQSRAIRSSEEHFRKKQKREAGCSDVAQSEKIDDLPPKVLRYFPQRKSVADAVSECPPRLSKDFLAGVFGRSL